MAIEKLKEDVVNLQKSVESILSRLNALEKTVVELREEIKRKT